MAGNNNRDEIVLVAEDDDGAYLTLQLAFRELGRVFRVIRARNGEETLEILRNFDRLYTASRPALILLNLHMPKMTGFDVLEQMRREPGLGEIPAVVFSSSELDSDRARCLALGARDFISKPDSFDGVVSAVRLACTHVAH